jgi:ribosomal protein S6
MWQMNFALSPDKLPEINHELRVNENVLRWIVMKRPATASLPTQRQMFWNDQEHGDTLKPSHS